jgi:hypothetical protein
MHQKNGTTIWGKPKLILIENWGSSCFVCHGSPRRPTTLLCRFEQLKPLGERNARLQNFDLKTQTPLNGYCTPKQLILHAILTCQWGFRIADQTSTGSRPVRRHARISNSHTPQTDQVEKPIYIYYNFMWVSYFIWISWWGL